MPQDADGSGLVSLLWGLWIYWTILSWCDYISSLPQAKRNWQSIRRSASAAIAPSKGPAVSANLEALVSEILRRSGGTTINDFLDDRLANYEAIVAAFDAGDRKTLQKLVCSEVYDTFSAAIAAMEARHETTETTFSNIEPPEIVAGHLDETHAEISIRFIAEAYRLSRRTSGKLIGGTLGKRRSIDIWTFAHTSALPAREWRLIAAEAGVR